jgi:hypothetical protein
MTWVVADVLAAAERASAAYAMGVDASRAAFEALGLAWHGLYQNADHQAVVSSDPVGRVYLSIAGTRFSAGKFADVLDDIETSWVAVGQGAEVLKGAYQGCRELYAWALGNAQVPKDSWWHVEGHSLGGWRARYAPLFMPVDQLTQLVTLESPRSANAIYYERFKGVFEERALSVVNGHDIFVDWPWLSTEARHPPQDWWHLLADGSLSVEDPTSWPGGISREDHDVDLVVSRLRALAAAGASTGGTLPAGTP